MNEIRGGLSRQAWRHVYRVSGTIISVSVALSIILTNMMMETLSAGINVQGLAVSIVVPIALGGPMVFVLMLKHEQLRHANIQLEQIATTDWLTACLNRRAFTGAVTRHLGRSAETQKGALLIVDADGFKAINDRFGHQQGDEALRLMASAIRNSVRPSDLVSRMGGEEFGVFLPDTDTATANQLAEQIRAAIATIRFLPNDKPCPLSVSIGGATYADRAEFDDLFRIADLNLYHAKNTGRDRVAMMQAA